MFFLKLNTHSRFCLWVTRNTYNILYDYNNTHFISIDLTSLDMILLFKVTIGLDDLWCSGDMTRGHLWWFMRDHWRWVILCQGIAGMGMYVWKSAWQNILPSGLAKDSAKSFLLIKDLIILISGAGAHRPPPMLSFTYIFVIKKKVFSWDSSDFSLMKQNISIQ